MKILKAKTTTNPSSSNLPPDSGQPSDTDDVGSETDFIIRNPLRRHGKSRSFHSLQDCLQVVTVRATSHIRFFTYFENPMLNLDELGLLLQDSWNKAQTEIGSELQRNLEINAYVSL